MEQRLRIRTRYRFLPPPITFQSCSPTTLPPNLFFTKLGMRNEVGFNYDSQGRIWGVENGIDNLDRPDLGPNLVFNNPGEEVNLFIDDLSQYNQFYGYPYCWSELFLPPATAKGPGTQWVHPHFMNTGRPEGIPFFL